MSEFVATGEPARESAAGSAADSDLDAASAAVAARIRDRAERVRRRELETALRRLAADGEVTAAERRTLTRLSTCITDALVERWIARLDGDEADAETALALLTED